MVAGATGTVGRHVVRVAEARGHDVVRVSRATGVDVVSGLGLDAAVRGADAVVDVLNAPSILKQPAVAFVTATTRNLLAAEARAGTAHHVAVSVVGIDGVEAGYYAGKLAQERLVTASAVPFSLLRATQFHEFAEVILRQTRRGRVAIVPSALLRPVAASEVAERLVLAVEDGPGGRLRELTGPRDERLADLVRRLAAAEGDPVHPIEVRLPGTYWRAQRSGVLRGGPDADRGTISFEEWLAARTG
ncbi:MAG: nucleoside-diphosphate sugar epimerase [Amnibacterium sp.]|nr:nucleoside-diphosphate sugar epimerase [Amnibacterium sp.]